MKDVPATFTVPTTEQVHAALARLTTLQLRRAFYSKLANPLWVAALHAKKVFSNPPSIERLDDGSYRVDPWPEIDYLVRMASLAPAEVAQALKSASKTDNPWVRRGIWEAAAVLPANNTVLLMPELKSWAEEDLGNSRTDPRDVSRVIVELLEGGQRKKGAQLAAAFYEPRPPGAEPEFGHPEPTSGIEPYWYADTLPSVAAALGEGRLGTLRRWLEKYQLHSNSFNPETSEDTSYIWRTSISGPAEHHAHEIGDALVEAVHRAAIESGRLNPSSLDALFASKQPLLQRIAIDALGEVLTTERSLDSNLEEMTGQRRLQLFARASTVLGNESFTENAYRPEFVKFAKAAALWPAEIDTQPFAGIVEGGPQALRDERRARLSREGDTEADTAARIQEYFEGWQHLLLAAIGSESLNPTLRERLAELDASKGVIENPIEPAWQVRSFTGPTSPQSAEQIKSMSDDNLFQHLKSWHPDPSTWAGPTHEGQGRVLSEAFSSQPGRLADRTEELKDLRPTYIRAILSGWQLAHEAGGALPWAEVVTVCQWAADIDDEATVQSEGDDFDDDSNYRNLKFQALQLLESGVNRKKQPEGSPPSIDKIPVLEKTLSQLAAHPEPTPEYEAKYGGDNMDPLTLSLNTLRPVALRSLIKLVHRYPGSTSVPSALATLQTHLGNQDPSLAVAAVYGEGIGRLYDSVKDWVLANVGPIFGTAHSASSQQQVALSTALAVHGYHPALLELLRIPMLLTLKELPADDRVLGWKGMRGFSQLLGDWTLLAFITGAIQLEDELMVEWFRCADAELRGDVLGHIGWQMMHWTEVDKEVLRRATELWDSRAAHVKVEPADAAELSHFYWFIRSAKLESSWWLPRLLEVASLVSDFQPRGMLGEPLGEAGADDPDTALAVLEILMQDVGPDHHAVRYDLYENAVPQVLAASLSADIPELTQRANTLMNALGAAGYIDILDRVRSRLPSNNS